MRAIQFIGDGKVAIEEIAEPRLSPDSVLVRPTHVAINPSDVLVEPMVEAGQIIGSDYAGVVEKVGSDVQAALKPGDRVFGALAANFGCDKARGAFADLIPAYGDFCFPTPEGLEDQAVATLGVAMATVCIAFYEQLGFPMPLEDAKYGEGRPFFVYAGSTTTGLMAIQLAKMSGFRVVTTCSPRNIELVKSRGADEVYDYANVDECTANVKASVGDNLQYAFVCFEGETAPRICSKAISSKGGKYATIVGGTCPRDDVESRMIYGQSAMCDPYLTMDGPKEQTSEQRELSAKFWKWALPLLAEGKIQPPPIEEHEGLEGALQGMDEFRNGKVSGKKIVSRLR